MERAASELERRIVRFTNIDTESFTHSFRGISITVKAGESYVGRLPEGNHLAKHLARKILAREKKKTVKQDRGVQLWTDDEVQKLKQEILSDVGEEAANERFTPEEARNKDTAQLADKYDESKQDSDVSKKDVIKELESRGIKVDESKSQEELLEDLMTSEAEGLTSE